MRPMSSNKPTGIVLRETKWAQIEENLLKGRHDRWNNALFFFVTHFQPKIEG